MPDDTDDDLELPDIFFIITDKILIFDHVNHKIMVVCNAQVDNDPETAYKEATREIDAMVDALESPLTYPRYRAPQSSPKLQLISNFQREEFEEVAENRLGDDAYASPAVAGGKIFLRIGVGKGPDRREQLVCIGDADA